MTEADIVRLIEKALASGRAIHCPNCEQRLRSVDQAATLAVLVTDTGAAPNGYLLCRPCYAKGLSDDRLLRIESRIGRRPVRYAITVARHPAQKALGLEAMDTYFSNPKSPWSCSDREWFTAHPSRSHRLREPFPDEDVEAGHNAVLVVQQEPGVRLRLGVTVDSAAIERNAESEAWAMAITVMQRLRNRPSPAHARG